MACKAVEIALTDGTGYMATCCADPARVLIYYDNRLEVVANSVRYLPKEWIAPSGIDVTDDFFEYARPLIGDTWPQVPLENGLQRFARLNLSFIDKKLPDYVPCRLRQRR